MGIPARSCIPKTLNHWTCSQHSGFLKGAYRSTAPAMGGVHKLDSNFFVGSYKASS